MAKKNALPLFQISSILHLGEKKCRKKKKEEEEEEEEEDKMEIYKKKIIINIVKYVKTVDCVSKVLY